MEIIINGLKADITLDTEKTLGDVLRNFELECSRNNATTVDITIDGETIRADQFDSVTARDIDHIHTLELTTVSEKDILDAFKQLSTVFETVISEHNNVTQVKIEAYAIIIKTISNTINKNFSVVICKVPRVGIPTTVITSI